MEFISLRRECTKLHKQVPYLAIIFPREMVDMVGLEDKDIVGFDLVGDSLEIYLMGGRRAIGLEEKACRFHIAGKIVRIPERKLSQLNDYTFPTSATKTTYKIQDDRMVIDISEFKKAVGFSALKTKEPARKVTGFGELKKAMGE